jgi:hypothetical protein
MLTSTETNDDLVGSTKKAQKLSEQQTNKYDQADLEEFCLWLYGLYEDEIVKSK